VQNQKATPQELTDLLTEGVNAAMEFEQSAQRDWTREVHGDDWKRKFEKPAEKKTS